MTDFPEPPPPPQSSSWKIILPVAIILLLCCLCLAAVSILTYLGTQGSGPLSMLATPTPYPSRTPTPTQSLVIVGDWDLFYSWDCTDDYSGPAFLTFKQDFTFILTEETLSYGSWVVMEQHVDFIFNDAPRAHYIGTLDGSGSTMDGTMETSEGGTGCWYADVRP